MIEFFFDNWLPIILFLLFLYWLLGKIGNSNRQGITTIVSIFGDGNNVSLGDSSNTNDQRGKP